MAASTARGWHAAGSNGQGKGVSVTKTSPVDVAGACVAGGSVLATPGGVVGASVGTRVAPAVSVGGGAVGLGAAEVGVSVGATVGIGVSLGAVVEVGMNVTDGRGLGVRGTRVKLGTVRGVAVESGRTDAGVHVALGRLVDLGTDVGGRVADCAGDGAGVCDGGAEVEESAAGGVFIASRTKPVM